MNTFYQKLNMSHIRSTLGRPLTLTDKILASHMDSKSLKELSQFKRGKDFVLLRPDRVAMQDATAQMAILQFIQSGCPKVKVPASVHCDHLITAQKGAKDDMSQTVKDNGEVYDFLKSAAAKYGMDFWGPGAGIIHQVILENYAFPGGLLIGTDSHTPNAGGLGMIAVGVGGADSVDVMVGEPWELLLPKVTGIHLKGSLKGFTAPKDIILKLLDLLTVKGGTNKIFEYFGPGTASLSATGKATITNMGAELGATASVFPFDEAMAQYLISTKRSSWAETAERVKEHLTCDPEVLQNPHAYFDEVIEIDLSSLKPHVVGPHTPDKARSIDRFEAEIAKEGYPRQISAALIGSCTNSSYEDFYKITQMAKHALAKGQKAKVPLYLSPGSRQILETIKRDGMLEVLENFGCIMLANACGPCIGQWKRQDIKEGQVNSIVTSFNRNFQGRNDSNPATLSFIASPEMVMAYAITGDLAFQPDQNPEITPVPEVKALPEKGLAENKDGFFPAATFFQPQTAVSISKDSSRLAFLDRFLPWSGQDFRDHLLLVKVKGKCTTDHISPAGKWLTYRGHLDKISDNMLLGASSSFDGSVGKGLNQLTGQRGETLSQIARQYKAKGRSWMIVAEDNYGEGSSREHAAMSPRFLGASAVIAKSFARIHETNLKKQGILALTFAQKSDYDKIGEEDTLSLVGLKDFKPGKQITMEVRHKNGAVESLLLCHTYNEEQIIWFQKGSSMNGLSV